MFNLNYIQFSGEKKIDCDNHRFPGNIVHIHAQQSCLRVDIHETEIQRVSKSHRVEREVRSNRMCQTFDADRKWKNKNL